MEKIEDAGSFFETFHTCDNYWGKWVLSPMLGK